MTQLAAQVSCGLLLGKRAEQRWGSGTQRLDFMKALLAEFFIRVDDVWS